MHVSVREYRDGDEPEILDLFARSFPHDPRTREAFDWKYRRNPFGNGRISLAFDESQNLVGHYAGYPVPFIDRGRPLLAHQIGDTMTDVSVRHAGRGPTSVLGRTALHFYDNFCDGRVAFNYGFNVANIQKFSLRFLRSDRVEAVPFRWRDPLPPISRRHRIARGYRLQLRGAKHEPRSTDFDTFFSRAAPTYDFLVHRNAAYLQWRYEDPKYIVVTVRKWATLAGWSVFRMVDGALKWGDALFDRRWPDAPEVLLRHVCAELKPKRVEAWFPARPEWWDDVLHDLGFRNAPEPQDLSLMCVPFAMSDATAAMRDRLYYTMGDGDLF